MAVIGVAVIAICMAGLPSVEYIIFTDFIIVGFVLVACSASNTFTRSFYAINFEYKLSTKSATSDLWANITDIATAAARSVDLEVRVGYFGVCVNHHLSGWICRSSAAEFIGRNRPADPLDAIGAAALFKDEVLFPGML